MDFLRDNKRLSFLYNGKCIWDFEMQTSSEEHGNKIRFEYLLSDGLKVVNCAERFPDFDACEWVTWFENTGEQPSKIISKLYDCDVDIPFEHDEPYKQTAYIPNPDLMMKIYAPSGAENIREAFYTDMDSLNLAANSYLNHIYPGQTKEYSTSGGRSANSQCAPFFNINRQGRGVIFAIGWTGQWNCRVERSSDFVNIKTKIEDTHFKLLPGEKIRTSSIVIMNYECDYNESQNKWRRLIKRHFSLIGSEGRAEQAPFCAGIWGGMTTAGVIERINAIKESKLPFEYIWMDAGWYGSSEKECPDEFEGDWPLYTGDWRVNKTYHPYGLLEVRKAINDAGMKFLLWLEPERVINNTPVASEHPEYFIALDNNDNLLLNLGNDEAWQYCFDMLSEKIEELSIDCYRQDFNIWPLMYWRLNDAEDRKGITEIKHITGLYRLWDALLERFPHLIIDNCASGGRRIDIETLRRSVPLWRNDMPCAANFAPEVNQTHNMTYGTWLPYSGSGTGREWGDVYRIRSSYSASMTTNYTFSERTEFGKDEKQLEWINKYGEEYLKVRPYFSCDFYPLTALVSGDDTWCTAQYNRPEKNDGIIQVFKRGKSSYKSAQYCLFGLDAEKIYEFSDADGEAAFELTGKELMCEGLKVTVDERRTAKLFFYKAK